VPTNWNVEDHQFEVIDGKLWYSPYADDDSWSVELIRKIPLKNVSVEFDGWSEGEGLSIVFTNESGQSFSASLGSHEHSGISLFADKESVADTMGSAFKSKSWSHFKISQNDGFIEVEIDGKQMITGKAPDWMRSEGYLSIASWGWPIKIDNVKVYELQ
jgi:hypothetical protein